MSNSNTFPADCTKYIQLHNEFLLSLAEVVWALLPMDVWCCRLPDEFVEPPGSRPHIVVVERLGRQRVVIPILDELFNDAAFH